MTRWIGARRRALTFALVIAVLGFALRIAWQIAAGFYQAPEVYEPDVVARNIVTGRGFVIDMWFGNEWQAFGMSFYPLLLALLHIVGGGPDNYLFVGIIQALASAGLAFGTYLLGTRLFDTRAGLVAAAIVALHPALIIISAKVTELNLDALIQLLIMLAAVSALRSPGHAGPLKLGWASALGTIARPTLAAGAATLSLSMALFERRRAFVLAAAFILVGMVPSTIRNMSLGYLGSNTPGNCLQLWIGNNPASAGDAYGKDGRQVIDSIPPDLMERVVGRPEREQGQAFCDASYAFLSSDPLHTAAWWAQKFGYFWWFTPNAGRTYPPGWLDLYRVAYAIECVLAAVGVAAIWRGGARRPLLYLGVMAVAIAASQSFFYVEGRHHLIIEPLFASAAAAGIVAASDAIRMGRTPRRARATLVGGGRTATDRAT